MLRSSPNTCWHASPRWRGGRVDDSQRRCYGEVSWRRRWCSDMSGAVECKLGSLWALRHQGDSKREDATSQGSLEKAVDDKAGAAERWPELRKTRLRRSFGVARWSDGGLRWSVGLWRSWLQEGVACGAVVVMNFADENQRRRQLNRGRKNDDTFGL
jgi:hypothetical protein